MERGRHGDRDRDRETEIGRETERKFPSILHTKHLEWYMEF